MPIPVQLLENTGLQYFLIYRKYRMSEQKLLNHRLRWNLTIQTILFTAYYVKMNGEESLRDVIPIIGISLTACILLSVIGSIWVLHRLREGWQKHIVPIKDEKIPDPCGAGSYYPFLLGLIPPVLIPIVFLIPWIRILSSR